MGLIDKLEEKYNFKVDKLDDDEKAEFFAMLANVQKSSLSVDKIRKHIKSMKYSVEKALIKEPEFKRVLFFKFVNTKQILLKGRLHNYMLLKAILENPKNAKDFLEDALAQMHNKFYL